MPLQATSGAASYDAFGGGVPVVPNYIEDVYSTYVYTGVSGSNVTINNGINLSVNGGLIWSKGRNDANPNSLTDTVRGVANALNSASIFSSGSSGISSFTTTGYVTNTSGSTNGSSSETYVSWTLRKQPKFFDIQTWTGSGANRTISHNLGSVPGCIMVKCLDDDLAWAVYHRSLANTEYLVLNSTAAKATGATWWNSTTPTSTVFSLGTDTTVNGSAKTYVAYIFAHDAGGFGLTGTDNVISCGSYTEGAAGTEQTINLGYEAQWLLIKPASTSGSWYLYDTMRSFSQTNNRYLLANSANAEASTNDYLFKPTATGFIAPGDLFTPGTNVIYIAIRRGPMKVPTSGASVYNALAWTGNATNPRSLTGVGFTPDNTFFQLPSTGTNWNWYDRLRGVTRRLISNSTTLEAVRGTGVTSFDMDGITFGADYNNDTFASQTWFFKRAPSFFDEVCYTGDNVSGRVLNHNLGVAAEFVIQKKRSGTSNWAATVLSQTNSLQLNTNDAQVGVKYTTASNSTTFTITSSFNGDPDTYVAYLFATCAGVSKVGSYTGNGSTQTIDCGFGAGGARFVLIKRYDSTGDWYVYDTVRGMTVLTDPYLFLNSATAQVATLGSVTTVSTGFALNSTILAAINISSATYIFLAFA